VGAGASHLAGRGGELTVPPRYTIRQVVGTYRRKAFGTCNDDGTPRRPAYPPDAIVAFYGTLELAEEQPKRGHFESERLLRVLLEGPGGRGRRFARQLPFLIEQEDLKPAAGGGLDVEGWEILQEGDTTIAERVARFHARKRDDPEYHDPLTGAQRTALYRLRQRVFERDHWTCRYCAVDDYPRNWLVAEHVIPDGPTTDENLVTACRGCNKRKGGRTPEEAGMPLLPVTPSDGYNTSRSDGDVTSPRDAPARVTSDGVTSDEGTVTPRTGDVRAPRRARNAVATATRRRLPGYEARETRAPETPNWFTEEQPEAPALVWLADHGATVEPNGGGLHVQLVSVAERHGSDAVIGALEKALAAGARTKRQFVFALDDLLDPPLSIPRAPAESPEMREAREMQERAEARRRARETGATA
jgi:hypothetical protein